MPLFYLEALLFLFSQYTLSNVPTACCSPCSCHILVLSLSQRSLCSTEVQIKLRSHTDTFNSVASNRYSLLRAMEGGVKTLVNSTIFFSLRFGINKAMMATAVSEVVIIFFCGISGI